MAMAKIRLCVDHPLGAGQSVPLNRDQAHYLFGVMRLKTGSELFLFNSVDSEYLAHVAEQRKHGGILVCLEQTQEFVLPPDLWLLFAPVKKTRTAYIVEKATELGVARVMPVQTRFTNAERIRQDRMQAHATEAAEQCGATFVPPVAELQKLDDVLSAWPQDRQLMFCDETLRDAHVPLAGKKAGPWAIVVGPEGGFSPEERQTLRNMDCAVPIGLGPRILRADTAVVAALVLWQSALGDWS